MFKPFLLVYAPFTRTGGCPQFLYVRAWESQLTLFSLLVLRPLPLSVDLFPGSQQSGPKYLVPGVLCPSSSPAHHFDQIALSSPQKPTMTDYPPLLASRFHPNNRLLGASWRPSGSSQGLILCSSSACTSYSLSTLHSLTIPLPFLHHSPLNVKQTKV